MHPLGERIQVAELRDRHAVFTGRRKKRAKEVRLQLGDARFGSEGHLEMHRGDSEAGVLKD